MSVVSGVSPNTRKLDVGDFFPGSNLFNEINAQDYIEDALQDGYGF